MTASGEIQYTFRNPYPSIIQRNRAQTVTMEVYWDGALVAPSSGTYSLYDAGDIAKIDAVAVTIASSIATYAISAAEVPETLSLGELWQERWALVMPDGTTRTVRRSAALARFTLEPAISDVDLTAEYPDIVNQLGSYGSNLQSFLDSAWNQFVIRPLYRQGQWPDLILQSSDTVDLHRHGSFYLIYKFLFAVQPEARRFERLMDIHDSERDRAASVFNTRLDSDQDGFADGYGREAMRGTIHRNGAPTRRKRVAWLYDPRSEQI